MGRLVFISYRRQRGYELAHLVNAELRSRGLRTFIDVADSDPGQFWAQAEAAIHSCSALVLICTNGSFETKPGDDWVVREVSEAMALGRPVVPVFSQDFEPPAALRAPLAQAIEYNGVSMDTQFHVAAFDHLSQLVGGRKRSEQRRRVAISSSLAFLTLLASLVLGAREIIGLTGEFRRERDARRAAEAALETSRADERRTADQRQREADARSEKLAQELAALEKRRADEQRAAAERQREADALSEELSQDLAALEQKRQDQIRAAESRERQAREDEARAKDIAARQAEQRRRDCRDRCQSTRSECESRCFFKFDGQLRDSCNNSCKQLEPFCTSNCQ